MANFKKCFLIFFIFILAGGLVTNTSASTIEELRNKIEESNKKITEIEQEIKKYEEEINKTSAESQTLKNQIKALELTRKKLVTDIKLATKQIETASTNIERLSMEIQEKNEKIKQKHETIVKNIKNIDENESISLIEIVLSSNDFSEYSNYEENLKSFQKELNINLEELKSLKETQEKKKTETELEKEKLNNSKSRLVDQQKLVEINKTNKNGLLTETKNKESNYKKILAEKVKLKETLDREIFNYEAQLKYELDPKTIPPAGSGVLRWPLDQIFITQKFGVTSSSRRLYVSGSHNGADFRASEGTRILSAGEGIIDGIGDTDIACPGASFGKWVLIKYDNGLATTYGHLSLIKVSRGERVSAGQLVGYSGNTGYSTGPHLHVSVYPKNAVNVISRPSAACSGKIYTLPVAAINAYLDPLLYF